MVRQPTARPTPSRTHAPADAVALDRTSGCRPPATASDRLRAALPWIALWTAALAVRLVYVIELRDAPIARILIGDALAYDRWARAIAAGDWLGHEVFYQAPLYPYFLGVLYRVVGTDPVGVRVVQSILGATACVLLGAAGATLWRRREGLVAGALLALDPTAVYFDGLVQKAVLDGVCFTAVLWTLARVVVRRRGWLPAGIALGLLGLTRENAQVLVAVVVAWAIIAEGRRALAGVGLLLLGAVLVVAPVAVRNLVVGGELHLTTSQLGANLYIGNNPNADGRYVPLRWNRGNAMFERDDARELAEEAVGHALTPGEVSDYWVGRTMAFVREQPGAWLRLMMRKWLLVWNAIELGDSEDQYTHADSSVLLRVLTAVLHFGVVCPLAMLGVVLTWDDRRLRLFQALGLVYAASVAAFFVFGRYRFPLVHLLLVFAAAGLVRAVATWRAHGVRPLVPALAAAAAAAIVANWPLIDRDHVTAATYYNVGGHLAADGDTAAAEEYLRAAIARQPSLAQAHEALGVVLFRRGQLADAVPQFAEALRLRPDFVDAHAGLASALLRLGRADAAVQEARAALALDPGQRDATQLLARALRAADRPDEAVTVLAALVAAHPDDPDVNQDVAMALAEAGRLDEAIARYRVAAAARPEAAKTRYGLGNVLAAAGRLAEAQSELEASVRLDPTLVDARVDLAQVLLATGRTAAAIAQLRAALGVARPGSADAARVAALLSQAGG